MKNILKICLLLTLCASLLLTVGCAKKDTESTQPQNQTEGTDDTKGTEGTEATKGTDATEGTAGDVENVLDAGNPEGDPFDAVDPTEGENEGGPDPADPTGGEDEGGPDPTEPEVDVEEDTEPVEDDFEVDFGDLT